LKRNVTLPGFAIDLVESLKKNSPPLTWTVVVVPVVWRPVCAVARGISTRAATVTAAIAGATRASANRDPWHGKDCHEEGPPPVTGSGLSSGAIERRPEFMLYAGLDLSRKRLDFHLLDVEGGTVEVGAAPPDVDDSVV
jgi:hypothetical protein